MTLRKAQAAARAEDGERIAIDALGWLAGDAERLDRFLALSGLSPQNLRAAAAQPGFLPAILDYLASDEALLTAFAAHSGRSPEAVAAARAAPAIPAFPNFRP